MSMINGSDDAARFFTAIREVEQERNSRIWCMIHKGGHICNPAMYSLFRDRHAIGAGPKIEILVHSTGGHPEIAYQMMKFFRRRFKEVNIIVPLMAQSAATLMCLGADKIFMGEMASLGPIDIQIDDQVKHGDKSFSPVDEFKSLEYMRELAIEWMDWYATVMNAQYGLSIKEGLKDSIPLVTSIFQPMFAQIDPIEMGGNRRSLAIGEEYAKRMLTLTNNPDTQALAKHLVWDYPSHDFCIDFEEAHDILELPVERLPEAQDRKLAETIFGFGRDYHGFVPPSEQPQEKKTARRPRRTGGTRRKGSSAPPVQRVNGSNGAGSTERVRT